ncbi:MAG TPA: YggS family pyridoxal phosphate-dependent enzyme [Steroidobacteraceae bacterium]|nr:YggS family pyridoxal phosphate-dependent enzyme [Steroidobacteraceae bacterium]
MLTGPHFSAHEAGGAAASNVRDRLAETRNRIASAAMRYGREADSVRLIAVSKTQPADAIRTVAALGQTDFAENYLQEALPKLAALADLPLTWHFIGQLQGNKTRAVAESFHWVHTLDRERIAVRLHEQRRAHAPPLNVCLQVRLEDEPGKGGISKTEVAALARKVLELPRLRLRGLMCIPPPREGFEAQRQLFAELADCARALREQGMPIDTLSMGMSGDLEAAVAAGATCVRIGTAIFGERK